MQGPTRFWQKYILHDIITACVIMHNMIIEDDRDLNSPSKEAVDAPIPAVETVVDEYTRF